jgi:hypothetical protein
MNEYAINNYKDEGLIEKYSCFITNILSSITLSWYGAYTYQKIIRDINRMSKMAFGDNYKELAYNFKLMGICFTPVMLIFVLLLFRVVAPGAILLASTVFGLVGFIYYIQKLTAMRDALMAIAFQFGRPDIAEIVAVKEKTRETHLIGFSILVVFFYIFKWLNSIERKLPKERDIFKAFNVLVDEHNSRLG